jgi:plastocyanin
LTIAGVGFSGLVLSSSRKPARANSNGQDEQFLTRAETEIVEIYMRSDKLGSEVWFDPIGVYIEPGQIVRWISEENVHTTTAYHPQNNNHSLRIPKNAKPWDSGFLQPGDTFEVLLTVEGIYDYFCLPHEAAGMVGRIIVGKPIGPGLLPFDYYKGKEEAANWQSVPDAARRAFPGIEQILRKKIIRSK